MTELIKAAKGKELPSISDFKSKEITFYGKEIESTDTLSSSDLKFLENINYEIVKSIDRDNLMDMVFVVMSNNLRAMGSRMVADDQVLLANDLTNELVDYFPQITIKEFELIIINGIRGNYETDTKGLSIVNFNYWARKYQQIKFKKNTEIANKLAKADQSKITPEKPVTSEDLIAVMREHYILAKSHHDNLIKKGNTKQPFDIFWMEHGLITSSGYLFPRLIKFNLIKEGDLKIEMDRISKRSIELNKKKEFTTINNLKSKTIRSESERIICCKLAVKLRTKKLKQNG